MPAYDYDCAACGRRFEVSHGVHADQPSACPLCGRGPVRKAITAAAIHYKGSGWAKKERRATASAGATKSTGEGSATEGSATEGSVTEGRAKERSAGEESVSSGDGPKSGGGASDRARPAPAKAAEAGATSTTD
jgi:putative FmdB family regulatory protein